VEIFKSIQGVRKKRSILCLVESSRPIPNLLKKRAREWLTDGYRGFRQMLDALSIRLTESPIA
jgi:hypothetical protein